MNQETNTRDAPIDVRSDAFADLMADYPYAADVTSRGELPEVLLVADDDPAAHFRARVLGFGSSYRETHVNHPPGEPPAKGKGCSGCRWTDTAILWHEGSQHYVYASSGRSAIAGERQRHKTVWTADPAEVLRLMFAPTKPSFHRTDKDMSIPPHNASAFRDAAEVDDRLADLVERYDAVLPKRRSRELSDPLAGL